MLKKVDADGDGTIDFEEFVEFIGPTLPEIDDKKFTELSGDELK
jgi:hypothetical protein